MSLDNLLKFFAFLQIILLHYAEILKLSFDFGLANTIDELVNKRRHSVTVYHPPQDVNVVYRLTIRKYLTPYYYAEVLSNNLFVNLSESSSLCRIETSILNELLVELAAHHS